MKRPIWQTSFSLLFIGTLGLSACAPKLTLRPRARVDVPVKIKNTSIPQYTDVKQAIEKARAYEPKNDNERLLRDILLLVSDALAEQTKLAVVLNEDTLKQFEARVAAVELANEAIEERNLALAAYKQAVARGDKMAIAQAVLSITATILAAVKR